MKAKTLFGKFPIYQINAVVYQDSSEYDGEFAGFIDTYEALSKIIPTNFTVIDFGCYLAAQCWFFRNHKRYIGVDTSGLRRFRCRNTTHAVMSIQKWIEKYAARQAESTFAICNYVPDTKAVQLVRTTFENVFCFYPAPEKNLLPVVRVGV